MAGGSWSPRRSVGSSAERRSRGALATVGLVTAGLVTVGLVTAAVSACGTSPSGAEHATGPTPSSGSVQTTGAITSAPATVTAGSVRSATATPRATATATSASPARPVATAASSSTHRSSAVPSSTTTAKTATPNSTAAIAAAHEPRCAPAALTVSAQAGSGAMQQQYATIRVRNGGAGCWLVGYARVGLLVSGRAAGHLAVPANAAHPALFLPANGSATASLHGPSTCNALLSDHARIAAPGQSNYTDAAVLMRVCALHIDAFRTA